MDNEIRTDCWSTENSNPFAPLGAAGVFLELPILKDYKKAEYRLATYLESWRNNTTPRDNPDNWIDRVRNSVKENGLDALDWPPVEGGIRDIGAVATLFRELRREILNLQAGQYRECAEILYKYIPEKYEYVASYREFWTLLAVYVVPEWPYRNFPNVGTSGNVRDDRYALKGTPATRDALAQYWWKYHILTNALGRPPKTDEWNNVPSASVWQERTNIFKNQEVVRVLTSGTALASDAAAKRLGKDLYICDAGSLAMDALLAKEVNSPDGLSPTAARLKINVEREDIADGLRKVLSPDRLDDYEEALKRYLASGTLPGLDTRDGAALLALAALGGYRLNRREWRNKEVDAGNAVKVLEAWRSEGTAYVFNVIETTRGTIPTVSAGTEVCAGHGYFKVGHLYTRTEIMAAGLASFDDQFKHWAEGSWTLGEYPLLVGNQNPGKYPGESVDLAEKTATVHSEKDARESNSGKRYLDKPTLLFWRHSNGRFEFLGRGVYMSHTAGPHNNLLIKFRLTDMD